MTIFVFMGAKNKYLDNNIPTLYRLTTLDVMIYTFIDAQRFTISGISVENAAISFTKRYKIDEDELSISSIIKTYFRIQKELLHEDRTT